MCADKPSIKHMQAIGLKYLSLKDIPREQCFSRVRLGACRLRFPEIQLQGYRHHFYRSIYGSRNIQDQGNPAYTSKASIQ